MNQPTTDSNTIQATDNIMIIDNKGYMNILNIKKDEYLHIPIINFKNLQNQEEEGLSQGASGSPIQHQIRTRRPRPVGQS